MRRIALALTALALAVGCGGGTSPTPDGGHERDGGTSDTDGGGGGDTDGGGGGDTDGGGGGDTDGGVVDRDAGGGEGGMAVTLDCASYCSIVMANCTGENAQYASEQNCLDTCEAFAPGMLGETSGNTLGCRIYHSMAAGADPATHCSHGGPLGGGACGEPCENFCQIAEDQCPDAYPSEATCRDACGSYEAGTYRAPAESGNTLACRMYHLTVAATDPAGHCGHVGRSTGGVCGP